MARIKSFEQERHRAGASNRLPPRLMPIEVRRIVGSVDEAKAAGLTRNFLARRDGANAPRYRSVYAAMAADEPLPPIEVYALRGDYFVVDGHNRVAAARALGRVYLDAVVHEFLLPVNSTQNRLHNERLHFERITGIHSVEVTDTGGYRKLLAQIREHKYLLAANGRPADMKAAAADWLEYVYMPIAERLSASGALRHFAGRTIADLYVQVCDDKWVKSQRRGMDIGFPRALADFERRYAASGGRAATLDALIHGLRGLVAPVAYAVREGHVARLTGRSAENVGRIGGPTVSEGDAEGAGMPAESVSEAPVGVV